MTGGLSSRISSPKPSVTPMPAEPILPSRADVGIGQAEVGELGGVVELHGQRLVAVLFEHADPERERQEGMCAKAEKRDVIMRGQGVAFFVGELQPRAGLPGGAVQQLAGALGLPPGDGAGRGGAAPRAEWTWRPSSVSCSRVLASPAEQFSSWPARSASHQATVPAGSVRYRSTRSGSRSMVKWNLFSRYLLIAHIRAVGPGRPGHSAARFRAVMCQLPLGTR